MKNRKNRRPPRLLVSGLALAQADQGRITEGGVKFLNPAAFAIPRPGTYGNLQRGALHGPNFSQLDVILAKRFKVTESTSVESRGEMFNIFNHTNFANPPEREEHISHLLPTEICLTGL